MEQGTHDEYQGHEHTFLVVFMIDKAVVNNISTLMLHTNINCSLYDSALTTHLLSGLLDMFAVYTYWREDD